MSGQLWVVGLGPGAEDLLTPRARAVLESADVVVGYRAYIDMVRAWLPAARCVDSDLGEETARAKAALLLAAQGMRVALVSGGDAGVYGMAGLALELAGALDSPPAVEIVPGVTAAQAAAAVAGAPLMTDYATLSLSDHLVPWEQIERRLIAATDAGFVLALYNPTSASRSERFARALELLCERRHAATPCAVVRDASRVGERCDIVSLGALAECAVDMRTIVIVGNATTRVIDGRLVTPRGYRLGTNGERGETAAETLVHTSPQSSKEDRNDT